MTWTIQTKQVNLSITQKIWKKSYEFFDYFYIMVREILSSLYSEERHDDITF